MTWIASEEAAEDKGVGFDPPEPLARVVHIALAIYLLPVVAVVCAIGGAAILVDKAFRPVGRRAIEPGRAHGPWHLAAARRGRDAAKSPNARDRLRVRVGR